MLNFISTAIEFLKVVPFSRPLQTLTKMSTAGICYQQVMTSSPSHHGGFRVQCFEVKYMLAAMKVGRNLYVFISNKVARTQWSVTWELRMRVQAYKTLQMYLILRIMRTWPLLCHHLDTSANLLRTFVNYPSENTQFICKKCGFLSVQSTAETLPFPRSLASRNVTILKNMSLHCCAKIDSAISHKRCTNATSYSLCYCPSLYFLFLKFMHSYKFWRTWESLGRQLHHAFT